LALAVGALSWAPAVTPAAAVPANPAGANVLTSAAPAAPADAALLAAIRSEQAAVVGHAFQARVDVATATLRAARSAVAAYQAALLADRSAAAMATTTLAAIVRKSHRDGVALTDATAANVTAQAHLATDRDRLRALALSTYTSGLPGLFSIGASPLQVTQEQYFAESQAAVVSQTVVTDLRSDEVTALRAGRTLQQVRAAVATDKIDVASDAQAATRHAAQVAADSAGLLAAQQNLTTGQSRLASVLAIQRSAISAVTRSASPSPGLSVMGRTALSPAQVAAWYSASGYADLVPATIEQLTGWYAAQGTTVGVRADVAFAQAVLETGGFSSPDAVTLNNYAGIGHCDSCAAGWTFPSPEGGVLGQLQLLRIFADPSGTPESPRPVLAALTASRESRHGCCSTWESLTGVWASDPTYASQILGIYQRMLSFTLSSFLPGTAENASQNATVP
jgi:mannosyl-glycoprotein endo-beta-N-acetylglucosaminidase